MVVKSDKYGSVGNVEVTLKLPYVVERQNQSNKHKNKQSLHKGFCPFLRYLGMSEGLTPVVLSTVAQYGAIAGSFEAARTILIDWGINISLKRIEPLTYYFGKIGIDLRKNKLNDLKSRTLSNLNTLKDQRVVIAADGGRTRIRTHIPHFNLKYKEITSREKQKIRMIKTRSAERIYSMKINHQTQCI